MAGQVLQAGQIERADPRARILLRHLGRVLFQPTKKRLGFGRFALMPQSTRQIAFRKWIIGRNGKHSSKDFLCLGIIAAIEIDLAEVEGAPRTSTRAGDGSAVEGLGCDPIGAAHVTAGSERSREEKNAGN